jgi:hypothetical protein
VSILANDQLHFNFDSDTGYWDLRPQGGTAPRLELARLGAIYQVAHAGDREVVYWNGELYGASVELGELANTPHGRAETLTVRARTSQLDSEPLTVTITFALPEAHPFLLWRVEAGNAGKAPMWLDVLDLVRVGPRFKPRSGRGSLLYRLRSLL